MTKNIATYVDRACLYAGRLNDQLHGSHNRAQMMADCCELHEITSRLYQMLYQNGPALKDAVDPVTFRFREYTDESRTEDATQEGTQP